MGITRVRRSAIGPPVRERLVGVTMGPMKRVVPGLWRGYLKSIPLSLAATCSSSAEQGLEA